MARNIKAKASKQRNLRRVWNSLVEKLSIKPTEPELTIDEYDVPIFYTQDEEDRHERHMKAIRAAQQRQL